VNTRAGEEDSVLVIEETGQEDGDERALAERAGADPDAFAVLYRRYVERIYAYAYWRSRSREVAEEVTAATFESAWRAMPAFQWKGGGFASWLYRIASTELAGWYRRAQRADRLHARAAAEPVHATGAGEPARDNRLDAVLAALPRLRPRYQEVITLRYLGGMPADQAAEAMGCSKATLAVTLHRALGALRREVAR
jgi:RNA polymerase sigma-70 factor (ECF subfamily)